MSDFLEVLDRHAAREEAKLDRIGDELKAVRDILTQQQTILDEHIKRSERLEDILDISKDELGQLKIEHALAIKTISDSNDLVANLSESLKPLLENKSKWELTGKLLTVAAGFGGAILAILKFFGV